MQVLSTDDSYDADCQACSKNNQPDDIRIYLKISIQWDNKQENDYPNSHYDK
jgi:hypothetical protein